MPEGHGEEATAGRRARASVVRSGTFDEVAPEPLLGGLASPTARLVALSPS